jgi:hypothetical protein
MILFYIIEIYSLYYINFIFKKHKIEPIKINQRIFKNISLFFYFKYYYQVVISLVLHYLLIRI